MEVIASKEALERFVQLIADAYVETIINEKMTGKADQSNSPVKDNEPLDNGSITLYHNSKEN